MADDTQVRKEQVAELYNQAATRYGRIGPPDGLHSRRKAFSVVGTKALVEMERP
jgi:hypothetical protein